MRLAAATLITMSMAWGQTASVAAISHRGEHLRHPENTLVAFRTALELGADYYEIDIRTTSDGRLVLMHDGAVDRTTDGHGEVAKMTFAEIRALDAGIKRGAEFAGTRVPTLDEAMDAAGASAGIYLDCKSVTPQALVDAIDRHKLSERVVLYGGADFLKGVMALRPALKAMPEARNPSVLKSLIESLKLRVAAFGASDWNDETIAVAREAKIDLYVDRLGPADIPEVWQDAIDRGATGIQTDKPGELVQYLRSKGHHK
jgi:glycerophosphoryl diester phosphodiesterase